MGTNETEEWEISDTIMWAIIFLMLFMWLYIGNFVFKNLTTGIIVNSFLQDSNEKRWAENEVGFSDNYRPLSSAYQNWKYFTKKFDICRKFRFLIIIFILSNLTNYF